MWCAIAMPPYGGFFMAVDPLQKRIFRGALAIMQRDIILAESWSTILAVDWLDESSV